MDTFPGDICVDCHRAKSQGKNARAEYNEMLGNFKGNVVNKPTSPNE